MYSYLNKYYFLINWIKENFKITLVSFYFLRKESIFRWFAHCQRVNNFGWKFRCLNWVSVSTIRLFSRGCFCFWLFSGDKTVLQDWPQCRMDSNSKPWGGLRNEGSLLVLAGEGLAGKTVEPLNWKHWQAEQKACVLYQRDHYFHWQNVLLTVLGSLSVLSVI